MRKYRHEVKILQWKNTEELQEHMNKMLNEDDGCKWRCDNHHLSDTGGWSIYSRHWEENPLLSEAKVRAQAVFNAMNNRGFHELFTDDIVRYKVSKYITDKIEEVVNKENQ